MTAQTKCIRRDPAEVEPWAKTCGVIRCLIEESDGAAGEVHYVEVVDATVAAATIMTGIIDGILKMCIVALLKGE